MMVMMMQRFLDSMFQIRVVDFRTTYDDVSTGTSIPDQGIGSKAYLVRLSSSVRARERRKVR